MPPAALMSSTACSTPFLSCAPKAALPPVSGPAMPSLTCAEAPSAKARPRPKARPSVSHCLIGSTSGWSRWERLGVSREPPRWPRIQAANGGKVTRNLTAPGSRIGAPAPAQQARTLVDPAITRDHLSDPSHPVAEQTEPQADRVVDEIIVKRQELAVEQGEVDEAHCQGQEQHVERELPPWPPCARNGDAGKPRSPSAHGDADQEEHTERVLFGKKFGNRDVHH